MGVQSSDNSATRLWVTACPCEESRRPPGEGARCWSTRSQRRGAPAPHPPRSLSGPVRWAPGGCSRPSKAGAPGIRARADARLSRPGPPPLAPLHAPSGRAAELLGRSDGAGGPGPLRQRAAPPQAWRRATRAPAQALGGLIAWAGAPARGAAPPLPELLRPGAAPLMGLSAPSDQAAVGAPSPLTLGQRGAWQDRLRVETVRSRRPFGGQGTKVLPRVWPSCHARLAFTRAACNILAQWHGFQPTASGCVPLSMAALGLEKAKIVA